MNGNDIIEYLEKHPELEQYEEDVNYIMDCMNQGFDNEL